MNTQLEFPLSIAPMMGCTDRHFRYLLRGITRHTLLYTEMITASAILHGDSKKLLAYSQEEKPLVLQIAGSKPSELAQCTYLAQEFGYDQVNLNLGCPSSRAGSGEFGACLMKEPQKVADCLTAMQNACSIPISVKHRLGLGLSVCYEKLSDFVSQTMIAGCRKFIVHARNAVLSNWSPKKNRNVPPLRYDLVYKLANDFPEASFEINGGVRDLQMAIQLLTANKASLRGVMIGRAAYQNPYMLALADQKLYHSQRISPVSRQEVIENYLGRYLAKWQNKGDRMAILRHALNLFFGIPGARSWRRFLSNRQNIGLPASELMRQANALIYRKIDFL